MSRRDALPARRAGIGCAASILFGAGLGMCISTPFGSDPMSVLISGLAAWSGISFSILNLILNLVFVLLVLFLDRRQIGLLTVMSIFLVSAGIQLYLSFCPSAAGLAAEIAVYGAGLLLSAYAIAVILRCRCGKTPYDALLFAIMEKLHTEYHRVRWSTDFLFLAAGVLLHGRCGIGTVINLLAMGKLVELFSGALSRRESAQAAAADITVK